MSDGMYRIGIVGGTTLAGKELADELAESLLAASDVTLIEDDAEAAGVVSAVGDEASFVRALDADSFARMDFVFFAGEPATARQHWSVARRAGASVVDLTASLEQVEGVPVRGPRLRQGAAGAVLDLETPAVVVAHPAAVMLALVATRLCALKPVSRLAATLLEPASQGGRAGVDELHQQTINLLSFQTLPQVFFDAQSAFNLLPALGDAAKLPLAETEARVRRHYRAIGGGALPELDLQVLQAPVFHGYVASVFVEFAEPASTEEIERALTGEGLQLVAPDGDPPSNLSAVGQAEVLVRVGRAEPAAEPSRRVQLTLAADNLKLHALNAIACANELRRLRPRGTVQ